MASETTLTFGWIWLNIVFEEDQILEEVSRMMPLEHELQGEMLTLYERWKAYGPPKNYFLQMVKKTRNTSRYKGPVGTVRYLLGRDPSFGFKSLVKAGRLDLTVEALILDPKWASLFTDWELKKAKSRIENAQNN